MDKIRSNLNKLTDTTYETVFDNIQSIVKEIIAENNIDCLEKLASVYLKLGVS